jgi:ABC-type transporter Mla subunit MlaD
MGMKDILFKTGSWLRNRKPARYGDYQPDIDDQGLINTGTATVAEEQKEESKQVIVKTVQPKNVPQSIEKLQAGFDRLIGQLDGINNNLTRTLAQNEELMSRIEQLPKLLENFPAVVGSQKQMTEQLLEQLKAAAAKEQQFTDIVSKIPTETAKQTDALGEINNQLAAAADVDVQMNENFNKFNKALEKLDQTTIGHTDSIKQMSKTYAASDRYLKYVMSRQRKSFMWVLMIAMGVCLVAILTLTGVIIYLTMSK